MDAVIRSVEALESQVGARPALADLKVIDHLDAQAVRWLAAAPLVFVGFSSPDRIEVSAAGGQPGIATVLDPHRLSLPMALLDDPAGATAGHGVGLLFLIPGLGETLRVNGVVESVSDGCVVIGVQECYAHCAKALLRSDFWRASAEEGDSGMRPINDLIAGSRFMALVTADAGGHTDVSPKGDPAGKLAQTIGSGLGFADRPGNRRTDSFRNLLSRPEAAALLVLPGSTEVLVVRGAVQLTGDLARREAFTVQDKVPTLVTEWPAPELERKESAALARAALWGAAWPLPDIDPAAVFAAHVRLNRTGGLKASLAKGAASIPGLMRKGLEQDYKRNLY